MPPCVEQSRVAVAEARTYSTPWSCEETHRRKVTKCWHKIHRVPDPNSEMLYAQWSKPRRSTNIEIVVQWV
jgi:hypothetical protein